MRELFIYYRLVSSNSSAAMAIVQRCHAELRAQYPQLLARLLCRTDTADGRQTWMETYATDPMRDPEGISTRMQAEIEKRAAALLPLLDGPRHTEVFIVCAS